MCIDLSWMCYGLCSVKDQSDQQKSAPIPCIWDTVSEARVCTDVRRCWEVMFKLSELYRADRCPYQSPRAKLMVGEGRKQAQDLIWSLIMFSQASARNFGTCGNQKLDLDTGSSSGSSGSWPGWSCAEKLELQSWTVGVLKLETCIASERR